MGLTEGQRQGMFKPQVRENSQMARLCDLADPLVDLLYVAPFKLPEVPAMCCTHFSFLTHLLYFAPFKLPEVSAVH